MDPAAQYICKALKDLASLDSGRLLDFGCGRGPYIPDYLEYGFDAYGCDVTKCWEDSERQSLIEQNPYRLPYPENHFDAVVSTSVLEHAQNTSEIFTEIKRVLKPQGVALHIFPTKWHTPVEPHIYVPLVNFFWPRAPKAWLSLWALLGVRNEYQQDLPWREVVSRNVEYIKTGLCYRTCSDYEKLSTRIYGNYQWAMDHLIDSRFGGFATATRKLPGRQLWRFIGRHLRMAVLLHRKT